MPKPLLLTQGGPPHFTGMVTDHEPRHRAYCDKWGYDYRAILTTPSDSYEKIRHIKSAFFELDSSGYCLYDYVFWLDADAIIDRFSVDLRASLPDWAWLGLTFHPSAWMDVVHANAGVMYMRVCDEGLAYLDAVLEQAGKGVDEGGCDIWPEQSAMNSLLLSGPERWQAGFVYLPYPWNRSPHFPEHNAIVQAWHGVGTPEWRRVLMQQWAVNNPWE